MLTRSSFSKITMLLEYVVVLSVFIMAALCSALIVPLPEQPILLEPDLIFASDARAPMSPSMALRLADSPALAGGFQTSGRDLPDAYLFVELDTPTYTVPSGAQACHYGSFAMAATVLKSSKAIC